MDNALSDYNQALQANIEVHTVLADKYNSVEPHYREESIARVDKIVNSIYLKTGFSKVLDVGCGTGFMIDILKKYADFITGVDITQAMLDRVNVDGKSKIELINSDTGTVNIVESSYDLVTAYSFLDHLFDLKPTLKKSFEALKSGGYMYADLNPNGYFWDSIKSLSPDIDYDPIITREIQAVNFKDHEIKQQFGIDSQVFRSAEYQKHVKGGFKEQELSRLLLEIGFTEVEFIYHWFIGQAHLINQNDDNRKENIQIANDMHNCLIKSLPLSRNLFKYVGFIAKK
jgi:ubiquinone/menaquinone biosynthesis C-methylase UbiE